MLEQNVFRMIMFIGAIIIIASLIALLMGDFEDIQSLLDGFFSYRLQKY